MSTNNERELLKKAYAGPQWAKKVDAMPDTQVIAVLRRLQARNKI